jgi:hypothetical protein
MGVIHLSVFIGAILALSALPGPEMMYIVGARYLIYLGDRSRPGRASLGLPP